MTAATSAERLRSVRLPVLSPGVWLVEGGMLLSSIGTGVVMPFLIIYLHDVRHLALPTAGLVSGAYAVTGLAATFGAGPAVDRLGDRAVLVGSLGLLTAGYALLGLAAAPWQAFACATVAGVGNGAVWPAQSVLLLRLVPPEQRHVAFSLNRMSGNLGLGIGALAGGALVAGGATGRFELLFLLDGASFAAFAVCAAVVAAPVADGPVRPPATGSYRAVLRDRVYLRVLAANMLFVLCGFAPLEAAVPYFAKHQAHAGSLLISAVFLANTLGVVVLQLPLAKAVEGTRRTRSLALAGVLWAAALAAVPLAAAAGAAVLLVLAGAVAAAECLHSATLSPLAADLAPPALRGRYMALVTSSWAVGFSLGPPLAGLLLAASPFAVWPVVAVGCLAASKLALGLERRLPAGALRTPGSD